jgi:Peptidase MA superfamily
MTGRDGRVVRGRVAILALMTMALVATLAAAPARAASVSFGTPTYNAQYDQAIDFSVDLNATEPLERIELWLRFPDTIGPYIVGVDDPGGNGRRTLDYTLDLTGSGHIVPNTRFQATWAAYPSGASQPVTSDVLNVNYQDTTRDWRTEKGDIVTVHWYDGSQSFAQKALAIGEKAIADTSSLLGVTETEPIDFFIYADDQAFRNALGPGTRENVGGEAHANIRTLFALITPSEINQAWVGTVIPHELVHLVFDTAVTNPYRFPPRWVNEGLAVYLSEGYGSRDQTMVGHAVASGDLMPLGALTGQFPTEPSLTSLAYAESVSAIDYLVRTYGQDALVGLVKAYKDGLTDDEAFTKALGVDLAAFQSGWLDELGAEPPRQYGPQPAPSGPVPQAWTSTPPASSGEPPAADASPSAVASTSPSGGSTGTSGPTSGGDGSIILVIVVLGGLVVLVIGGAVVVSRRRGA